MTILRENLFLTPSLSDDSDSFYEAQSSRVQSIRMPLISATVRRVVGIPDNRVSRKTVDFDNPKISAPFEEIA
jgi:hypothetical protein